MVRCRMTPHWRSEKSRQEFLPTLHNPRTRLASASRDCRGHLSLGFNCAAHKVSDRRSAFAMRTQSISRCYAARNGLAALAVSGRPTALAALVDAGLPSQTLRARDRPRPCTVRSAIPFCANGWRSAPTEKPLPCFCRSHSTCSKRTSRRAVLCDRSPEILESRKLALRDAAEILIKSWSSDPAPKWTMTVGVDIDAETNRPPHQALASPPHAAYCAASDRSASVCLPENLEAPVLSPAPTARHEAQVAFLAGSTTPSRRPGQSLRE